MSEKNIYRPDGSADLDKAVERFSGRETSSEVPPPKTKASAKHKIMGWLGAGLLTLGIKQGVEAMEPVRPQEVPNRTPERTATQNPDLVEEGTNPEAEKQAAIAGMEAQSAQEAALEEHAKRTEEEAAAEADKYRDILGIDKQGE